MRNKKRSHVKRRKINWSITEVVTILVTTTGGWKITVRKIAQPLDDTDYYQLFAISELAVTFSKNY